MGKKHKKATNFTTFDSNDFTIITAGPVGKTLGTDPSGFRIVTMDGNKLSYAYYSPDSIPVGMTFTASK